MIKAELFNKFNRNDYLAVVKHIFNTFGRSYNFLSIVDSLLKKQGTVINDEGCSFPEDLDEDELYNDYGGIPFEGVNCWSFDNEVTVSEEEFFKVLKMACERYIELHPEKKEELEQIISQSTLL